MRNGKRMLYLLMAALGSVSGSVCGAAKGKVSVKRGLKTSSVSNLKKTKKSDRKKLVSYSIASKKLKKDKNPRSSTTFEKQKKNKESSNGRDIGKEKVTVLNSEPAKGSGELSKWERMSDVEKGFAIGVPAAVVVGGAAGTLAKRVRDAKLIKCSNSRAVSDYQLGYNESVRG